MSKEVFSSDISFWVEEPQVCPTEVVWEQVFLKENCFGRKPIHRWSNFLFWIEKWDENGTDCDDLPLRSPQQMILIVMVYLTYSDCRECSSGLHFRADYSTLQTPH